MGGRVGWQVRLSVFCQAEDGIRDLVRSRGLGDVYKRQVMILVARSGGAVPWAISVARAVTSCRISPRMRRGRVFYTSDAAPERCSVGLGGPRGH